MGTKVPVGEQHPLVSSISSVPVTVERKPFVQQGPNLRLEHAGTSDGTTLWKYIWRGSELTDCPTTRTPPVRTLQRLNSGLVGFHRLRFGILLSLLAVSIIHTNFSYPTVPCRLPDPLFHIYVINTHKDKHGSDTGTYDTEGRFVPQKFEDMFAKYADGKDSLSIWEVWKLLEGQRLIADPIGWFGAFFEWQATYIMLWPEDGRMMKEDIRRVYDGGIFYTIAARRARNEPTSTGDLARDERH
ncbi:uncharacterized protein Z519_08248 [Cladophialophora bantiana CBS 173.52]|uniref:Caleosin domain-containing protein n=1 Tax=Cladophialophora bantiana (strain ATCC 10958 / CBS 173.52 / CDC B-1940 / NIH 8579) TaxID=1442370 RepID=A0A0D2FXZ9_CLAB1|nr:uncharacterized protein Z519_08248 [Cladophialophora bantiana CBS 173.52]KIW91352.1 hypothetical protein Z519_08248 [Cladophialophora bantiana CBS 173.52]